MDNFYYRVYNTYKLYSLHFNSLVLFKLIYIYISTSMLTSMVKEHNSKVQKRRDIIGFRKLKKLYLLFYMLLFFILPVTWTYISLVLHEFIILLW